jgi:t-SNARE complex subunit (syntaxin)
MLMIEAKVDDLASKHPEHAEAIRVYNAADPTPTKKFLPWLVNQHIAGNVKPDDPNLHSTLKNFDKIKHTLDNKDHSGYHYNDLANKVGDRVKAKEEQEAKKNAVETIHSEPNGITAQHIKTKEASQDLYGGGEERGGKKGCARGTSWCTSARSGGNAFGQYGHMYTIHDPHDDNAPYAVHPFDYGGASITSRHNDGDKPYKDVLEQKPHLKNAVNNIMKHSAKHIDEMINSHDEDEVHLGIKHPNATPEHITKALNHNESYVRRAAIRHPNATSEHIDKALNDEYFGIRTQAIRHPKATAEHITKALNDAHYEVRAAAVQHPKVTSKHITKALSDEHSNVREAAIKNPNATSEHIAKALNDEDFFVRRLAIKNPNATSEHITKALDDEHHNVRRLAIKNPNATSEHIAKALNDEDFFVRQNAIMVRDNALR